MIRGIVWIIGVAIAALTVTTYGSVVVTGESMRPALARGDVVVYRRTSEVPVGEVALFGTEGTGLVVHRVVGQGERGVLRTKGDANTSADVRPVPRNQVRGRVVLRVPSGSLVGRIRRTLCYTSQSVAQ